MKLVMTVVWYPWTESVRGAAATEGAHRTLFLEMDDARFERLPAVGELIFFEDGGSAAVETVGWKIDGTPYLYLGQRFEKNGEALAVWTGRGFKERTPAPTEKIEAPQPAATPAAPATSDDAPTQPQATGQADGSGGPQPAPPMPPG